MDLKKYIRIGLIAASVAIAIALAVLILDLYNDHRIVARDRLPASITNFVREHFPHVAIRSAEIDFLDYTVWLEDDTCIEFEWNRRWERVENYKGVEVQQLLPDNLLSFIASNYPCTSIAKVSIDDHRYEVSLVGSHHELLFSKTGAYIGADD
jgi:hypothetical protein